MAQFSFNSSFTALVKIIRVVNLMVDALRNEQAGQARKVLKIRLTIASNRAELSV